MSKPEFPFVRVVWNDAQSPGLNESYEPTNIPHAPVKVETWGWALRQDEAGVTVANERFDDGRFRGLTFIPGPMLVELTRLSVQARKVKPKVKPTPPAPPAPGDDPPPPAVEMSR